MPEHKIYIGQFENKQVDYSDQSENTQTVIVTIEDQGWNPFNVVITQETVGPNIDFTFTFDELPAAATGTGIGYSSDGGITWNSNTGGVTSPRVITLPYSAYIFTFVVQLPTGNIITYFEADEVEMQMADNPVSPSIVDNDEDKFTPIRSKSFDIRVHTDSEINITTFSGGGDNQYQVKVYIDERTDDNCIFTGWLSISDLRQTFLPDPNVLILTAKDGLNFIEKIPLVDYNGTEFSGENRLMDYIAGCLRQTGLDLPIYVEMNIKHGSGELNAGTTIFGEYDSEYQVRISDTYDYFFYPGQEFTVTGSTSNDGTYTVLSVGSLPNTHYAVVQQSVTAESTTGATLEDTSTGQFYDKMHVHCLTFEKGIGEFEDCKTVLQKILGEYCTLSQQKNAWHIKTPDEFDNHNSIVAIFEPDGTFNGYQPEVLYEKQIGNERNGTGGFTYDMGFVNDDAEVSSVRPVKSVEHEYGYETANEIPCNSNFERGDVDDDTDPLDITYEIECWTLRNGMPGSYTTVDFTALIHRIFDDDSYERERYVTLTPTASAEPGSANARYIESEPIYVQEDDKFSVSVDFRLTHTESGVASVRMIRAVLNGDDGSWWILDYDELGDNPVWRDTAGWTLFTGAGDLDIDFEIEGWRTLTLTAAPVPVTGKLYIWLNQLNQNGDTYDNHDLQYNNLKFNYTPFINGGYREYTGQRHKSEQDINNKDAREVEVYISDSPKRLFKGALLFKRTGDDVYVLASRFWNAAVHPLTPPSSDYVKRFGEIQNQTVWNQYNRVFYAFEGNIDGLDMDKLDWDGKRDLPDLLHTFYIRDSHATTNNKKFILLHYEQDLDLGEWSAYLVEAFDTTIAKNYLGHSFKYIESDRR